MSNEMVQGILWGLALAGVLVVIMFWGAKNGNQFYKNRGPDDELGKELFKSSRALTEEYLSFLFWVSLISLTIYNRLYRVSMDESFQDVDSSAMLMIVMGVGLVVIAVISILSLFKFFDGWKMNMAIFNLPIPKWKYFVAIFFGLLIVGFSNGLFSENQLTYAISCFMGIALPYMVFQFLARKWLFKQYTEE